MDSSIKLTRDGIANDLKKSPYKHAILYGDDEIEYIFSSTLYKTKFIERMIENREKIQESLSKRFGFEIVNSMLCDIKLYSMIEKRGFLINLNKESIECLNNITLDGNHLIYKN